MFEHLVEAATWKTDKVLDKVLDEVQNSKQFLLSARCKRLRFSSDFAEEKWPFGQRTSSSTLFEHLVEAATWKTDKLLDKALDEVQKQQTVFADLGAQSAYSVRSTLTSQNRCPRLSVQLPGFSSVMKPEGA